MRFQDQAVLVTGATGGIGQAIAAAFADAGAHVAVHTAHHPAKAKAVADELPGGPHVAVQADLLDPEARRRLVDEATEELDGLDVLVNNAGLYEEHPVLETGPEAWEDVWQRTLALNLQAPADLCYWAAARMAGAGGGAIVNVTSRGAKRGEPTAPAYGAAKAGLNALTGSLAQALGDHGVRVTAVAPGFVETPMVEELLDGDRGAAIRAQSPLDRVARPEEVAEAVLFLASDACPFATGAILDVNGASDLRG